jgi:hypothetical protein
VLVLLVLENGAAGKAYPVARCALPLGPLLESGGSLVHEAAPSSHCANRSASAAAAAAVKRAATKAAHAPAACAEALATAAADAPDFLSRASGSKPPANGRRAEDAAAPPGGASSDSVLPPMFRVPSGSMHHSKSDSDLVYAPVIEAGVDVTALLESESIATESTPDAQELTGALQRAQQSDAATPASATEGLPPPHDARLVHTPQSDAIIAAAQGKHRDKKRPGHRLAAALGLRKVWKRLLTCKGE